jgi:hypothetical protein
MTGGESANHLAFRRCTFPLPSGRVRVQIEVRQGSKLAGRIVQVRGGWQFRSVGSGQPRKEGGGTGEVFRTTEECKKWVAESAVEGAEEGKKTR